VPLPNPMSQFQQTLNGHTDVVTAVVIWAYSIGVIIVIAIVYFILNKIPALDNLGRKNRNVHDTQMENIIGHLSKLTFKQEKDEIAGGTRWVLGQKAADEDDED